MSLKWTACSILCAGAVWLAHDGKPDWGWLLVGAIILAGS